MEVIVKRELLNKINHTEEGAVFIDFRSRTLVRVTVLYMIEIGLICSNFKVVDGDIAHTAVARALCDCEIWFTKCCE